jgi:hypothetical protein
MGFVRRALAAIVGASAMLWVAAAPVAAIPPSFFFQIYVNDCKTGTPIRAGAAVFSAQHAPLAAAAPLADGIVGWPGPIGLGDFNWITSISAPGYRTGQWVIHGRVYPSQIEPVNLCLHPDRFSTEHLVDTTFGITGPTAMTIGTDGVAQLTFTASPSNCSSLEVEIGLDSSVATSLPLSPGDTVFVPFPPQAPGDHALTVNATSLDAGCTTWAGTLVLTTSASI